MLLKLCGKKNYGEIPQSSPVVFSIGEMLSAEEIEMQFWWIKCRDFLNEYCLKQSTGKDAAIYQFDTSIMKQLGSTTPVFLLAKGVRKKKTVTKVVEEFTGWSNSTIILPGGVLAFEVPRDLFEHTVLVSYITHLIRFVDMYGKGALTGKITLSVLAPSNERTYALRLSSYLGACSALKAYLAMRMYYNIRASYRGESRKMFDFSTAVLHNNAGMLGALAHNYGNITDKLKGYL